MPITRRDLLWGLGGGAAGLLASPVPWKLTDDIAIWTQRRHKLPVPPDGPRSFYHTACTLCPAGCAVRVSLVGKRAIATCGARHPLGDGACAIGLTLHQLALHPLRRKTPALRGRDGRFSPATLDAAVATLAAAVSSAERARQSVVILDQRPGRAISSAYRAFASGLAHGVYATVPGEDATLAVLQPTGPAPLALGFDIERARTLLSFGAPVLEGWGHPGRILARRPEIQIIQLDGRRSPTAEQADEWLDLAPRAAGPLALALAHVLLREGLVKPLEGARAAVSDFSPASVAAITGIAPARIEALARTIARGPAVAVGGGDPAGGALSQDEERAIALLNVVLGSVGVEGGIVPRHPVPEGSSDTLDAAHGTTFSALPDRSVGVLILDGIDTGRALPWPALEPKLAPQALVASLSPFDGALAREAQLRIPSPAPLESFAEVLPGIDASRGSYALATPAPVTRRKVESTEPLEVLLRVAKARGASLAIEATPEALLRQRAGAIVAARRGRFLARGEQGFNESAVANADEAWKVLSEGGCWIDDALTPGTLRVALPLPAGEALERWKRTTAEARTLTLAAFATRGSVGAVPLTPIMSKLYQESTLRPAPGTASLNPETARALGLRAGRRVRIESAAGAVRAELRLDPTLPPGRVAFALGPDAFALAVVAADGRWRDTPVTIREA